MTGEYLLRLAVAAAIGMISEVEAIGKHDHHAAMTQRLMDADWACEFSF